MIELSFSFIAEPWMYQGKGAWCFVTLPKDESQQVKAFSQQKRGGWGSVRVKATIGETAWRTSIFPDTKAGAYLLPLKAEVRGKEGVQIGVPVAVRLDIPL